MLIVHTDGFPDIVSFYFTDLSVVSTANTDFLY